jgi:hypothetical protein
VIEDMLISDMVVLDLDWQGQKLTIIKETDQLLRRFGQMDMIKLNPKGRVEVFRSVADEIWAPMLGRAAFQLEDQREESPSKGEIVQLEITADDPKAILVPFGVNCTIVSAEGATLLRIGTHGESTHPGDRFQIS